MNFYTLLSLLFLLACVSACNPGPTSTTVTTAESQTTANKIVSTTTATSTTSATTTPTSATTTTTSATTTTTSDTTTTSATTTTYATTTTTTDPVETTTTAKIQCPNGWIDAQSQNLGCVNFFNEVSLTWFEAHDVCQDKYSAFLVEALSREEAEFLFQIAEMIQLYSSNETWWIGLTDFYGRYVLLLT